MGDDTWASLNMDWPNPEEWFGQTYPALFRGNAGMGAGSRRDKTAWSGCLGRRDGGRKV